MSTTPDPSVAAARPSLTSPAAPAQPVVRTSPAADVALVATFAALIAVCAIAPAIPTGTAVPVTLQTFGVALTGLVLGWRRGALAVLLYLAVGLAGVPVFSGGRGGVGVLAGPSAGYLLAFPLAAPLAGFLAERSRGLAPRLRFWALFGAATAGSLVFVHPLGVAVLAARLDLTTGEAIAAGAAFLPGDVVKNLLAALVATAVLRAFPHLNRGRP